MRIGCQIGLWGYDREKITFAAVIEAVGRLRIGGMEVFDTDIAGYYGKADELKARLREAKVALTGAYFAMDESLDLGKEAALVARAVEVCEFLRSVGSRYLILNGGAKKDGRTLRDGDYRQLAKVMNRIGEEARARGIEAVMHAHIGCMVERPEEVDRLVAGGIDRKLVGLCPHAGHQQHVGADPYVIYEKYGSWTKYLHIGDVGKDNRGAVVGAGVLDQRRLMKPLLEAGYDGWVIIEGAQQGVSPEDYATRSREYMVQTWPQVKRE